MLLLSIKPPNGWCFSAIILFVVVIVAFAITLFNFDRLGESTKMSVLSDDITKEEENGDQRPRSSPSPPPSNDDAFNGRRIRPFERDGIVIPDRSIDSREWNDFERPQACNVTNGYVACFQCVETRYSMRVCVHLSKPLAIYDEKIGRTIVLPANESTRQSYCLREQVARSIRDMNANDKSDDSTLWSSSVIRQAKRECSSYNADWLLVRRREHVDSTYNFVCRYKYRHANLGEPMSACSRDVACNRYGRLDDETHNSRVDPFVNGRCLYEDNGWIAEHDARGGVGPYCREATFAEWPSAFFGWAKHHDHINLHANAIDRAFDRFRASRFLLRRVAPESIRIVRIGSLARRYVLLRR